VSLPRCLFSFADKRAWGSTNGRSLAFPGRDAVSHEKRYFARPEVESWRLFFEETPQSSGIFPPSLARTDERVSARIIALEFCYYGIWVKVSEMQQNSASVSQKKQQAGEKGRKRARKGKKKRLSWMPRFFWVTLSSPSFPLTSEDTRGKGRQGVKVTKIPMNTHTLRQKEAV